MQQQSSDNGRQAILAEIRTLPALLAGRVPDPANVVATALRTVAIEALTIIKGAYVTKARGGSDESGLKWAPLQPKTIAYSRRHPGLTRQRSRAAKAGRERRPLLSAAQDQLWRAIYASAVKRGEKPGNAAARAWAIVKARGGQTILEKYGQTQVEILRDTGRLLNSLSPGAPDNRMAVSAGRIAVGTNVVYAEAHHRGNPKRKLPARPLWPEVWPDVWTNRLATVLKDAVALVLADVLRR